MSHIVIMPKQGQSVESCILTDIKKKVGDKVKTGDILFSYETDKASFEEESKVEGTVLACFFSENDEVPVLSKVMVIGNEGEEIDGLESGGVEEKVEVKEKKKSESKAGVEAEPQKNQNTGAQLPQAEHQAISPRARKLAHDKGVDTSHLQGTGPHGRIIEADVTAAAATSRSGLSKAMATSGNFELPSQGSGLAGMIKSSDLKAWETAHEEVAVQGDEFRVEKMSNVRKLIAKSMYNSLQNSAQLTHMLGADARTLQALRKKAKKAFEEGKIDANITINDFVCYALIRALQKFPTVNSHCLGDSLRLFNTVNLGVAVDTPRGLMVPAVKNAENYNIVGLSKVLKKTADDCRKGSINPDLLSAEAASFTISNLGGFGVEWFTPVLNLPQSGILGVGSIVPRPKDLGGGVYAFVPYLGLSFTYDHRSIDGGEATRFLNQVATEIENLESDLI